MLLDICKGLYMCRYHEHTHVRRKKAIQTALTDLLRDDDAFVEGLIGLVSRLTSFGEQLEVYIKG